MFLIVDNPEDKTHADLIRIFREELWENDFGFTFKFGFRDERIINGASQLGDSVQSQIDREKVLKINELLQDDLGNLCVKGNTMLHSISLMLAKEGIYFDYVYRNKKLTIYPFDVSIDWPNPYKPTYESRQELYKYLLDLIFIYFENFKLSPNNLYLSQIVDGNTTLSRIPDACLMEPNTYQDFSFFPEFIVKGEYSNIVFKYLHIGDKCPFPGCNGGKEHLYRIVLLGKADEYGDINPCIYITSFCSCSKVFSAYLIADRKMFFVLSCLPSKLQHLINILRGCYMYRQYNKIVGKQ